MTTATDVLTALTTMESDQLATLEAVVMRGQATFIEVGLALATIRDERLYRANHPTFETYLTDRWPEIGRRRAYQLMDAAEVAGNVNHGTQTITNERQARALSGLAPEQQRQAVTDASVATNGKLTSTAIEQAAAKYRPPADYRAIVDRVTAIGGRLRFDGEYHLTIGGETRHSSQWALIKEAIARAEAVRSLPQPESRAMLEAAARLGQDLSADQARLLLELTDAALAKQISAAAIDIQTAQWEMDALVWHIIVMISNKPRRMGKTIDGLRALVSPAAPPATPSAPVRVDPPDHAASPISAPPVQPTVTIGARWEDDARSALRSFDYPVGNPGNPKDHDRIYTAARDLLVAMAVGRGVGYSTVTAELAARFTRYAAPSTIPVPPAPAGDIPYDLAARARVLGVILRDAGDGCVIPHWPDEDVRELTGMDSYETRGWLLRTAPALAGDRLASGTLTLPGIGWDDDTHATAEDYADVCAFLSDLAAAEAGGSLDTQTIRDMGDVLEGLVAVFDDDTYSALAGRVTTVQRGV